MPRAIIGALAVCTVLYILVSAIMVGLVPYIQLKEEAAPIAAAITAASNLAPEGSTKSYILKSFSIIIKIGAVLGLSSTMVVQIMGQPRSFTPWPKTACSRMGRQDPPALQNALHHHHHHRRHRRRHGRARADNDAGAISEYRDAVRVRNRFHRRDRSAPTRPELPRPFKVPFSPVVPILSALASLYLMYGLPFDTWMRLIVWMLIGLGIYFAYSVKHSKLRVGA